MSYAMKGKNQSEHLLSVESVEKDGQPQHKLRSEPKSEYT